MKYTSSEASKLLKKLKEECDGLNRKEKMSSVFIATIGEELESIRPEYDYEDIQSKLIAIEAKIRKVKHAINAFNVNTTVPGFDMSIDQMLIYIPQMSARKEKLAGMKDRLPKQREAASAFGRSSTLVEYSYANYDIATTERDYESVSAELSKAQTALDLLNNTSSFEIEL